MRILQILIAVLAPWAGASVAQQPPPLVPRPVLKLIVEHPALAPYLHPEAPGRVPLVVSDHLLEPGVTLSRFGQPLRIVPDREVGTEPHRKGVVDGRGCEGCDEKIVATSPHWC